MASILDSLVYLLINRKFSVLRFVYGDLVAPSFGIRERGGGSGGRAIWVRMEGVKDCGSMDSGLRNCQFLRVFDGVIIR